MSYQYDSQFFDFVNASAGKSASLFIGQLLERSLAGTPASVLDVGCGRGVWLAEWRNRGLSRISGVDGDYVSRKTLLIPAERFRAVDISRSFDLGERFDLVECLEVAEHIPESSAETLIDNLCRHGDLILFSAAIPGQGGEHHVNERPYGYWRSKFEARGYRTFDAIREHVRDLRDIEPWYRYNTFVFARAGGEARLSATARQKLVAQDRPVRDVAPLMWRARCLAVAMLPKNVASHLARLKHRVANAARRP
jgi:SAM-dependent methyltransferase